MTFGSIRRDARRLAGTIYRDCVPPPEVRAWRHACALAESTPRFTRGTVRMMGYDLEYSDLLTLCPQWHDIFVERSLAFEAGVPNPRILDCGANVGLSALFYKREYPRARITAYEADPEIAAQLARNLRVNGGDDIEVVSAAVWIENGVVSFAPQGADAGTLDRFSQRTDRTSIQVAACRLADVVAREPIDLLKLDVEGAELDVLRDIGTYLRNVRALQLEVHEFRADCRRLPEVLTILSTAGFRYSIARATHLPWLDARRERRTFPQCSDSLVVAVCAWRPESR
jgi:FkbM family methyltransferase